MAAAGAAKVRRARAQAGEPCCPAAATTTCCHSLRNIRLQPTLAHCICHTDTHRHFHGSKLAPNTFTFTFSCLATLIHSFLQCRRFDWTPISTVLVFESNNEN